MQEYWFENLNLRGDYKAAVLHYIHSAYPQLDRLYQTIYQKGDSTFWTELQQDFTAYCETRSICYVNAFNHARLVNDKKQNGELMRRNQAPEYRQLPLELGPQNQDL